MDAPQFKCYLVAPAGLDTRRLIDRLQDLGVDAGRFFDLDPPGVGLPTDLRQQMRNVDFVCAIFQGEKPSLSVALEVGVAIGLGKKVFIISSAKADLPWALSYLPTVRSDLQNLEPVAFHLKPFLANLTRKKRNRPFLDILSFSNSRKHVQQSVERFSESQLASAIGSAFESRGANVQSQPLGANGDRPDMLIWLDEAPSGLGSPLVVEVKYQGFDEARAYEQITKYMHSLNARTGILVSGADDRIEVVATEGGYIFTLSQDHLLDLIVTDSLLDRLTEQRNAFVHGGV